MHGFLGLNGAGKTTTLRMLLGLIRPTSGAIEMFGRKVGNVGPAERRRLFNEVQRIFAENLPVLYFAAPRLYYGHSTRVTGVVPSILRPPVLWNADRLGVTQ